MSTSSASPRGPGGFPAVQPKATLRITTRGSAAAACSPGPAPRGVSSGLRGQSWVGRVPSSCPHLPVRRCPSEADVGPFQPRPPRGSTTQCMTRKRGAVCRLAAVPSGLSVFQGLLARSKSCRSCRTVTYGKVESSNWQSVDFTLLSFWSWYEDGEPSVTG